MSDKDFVIEKLSQLNSEFDSVELTIEVYINKDHVDTVSLDVDLYFQMEKFEISLLEDNIVDKVIDAIDRGIPDWHLSYSVHEIMEYVHQESTIIVSNAFSMSHELKLDAQDKRKFYEWIEFILWEDEDIGVEQKMLEKIG